MQERKCGLVWLRQSNSSAGISRLIICCLGLFVAITANSQDLEPVCGPKLASVPTGEVTLTRMLPSSGTIQRPVDMVAVPGSNDVVVVAQAGRIYRGTLPGRLRVWADLRDLVEDGPNEAGLLSLAFHPDYPRDPRFFVYYTRRQGRQLQVVIASWRAALGQTPRPQSTLLTIDQPYGNHNGGQLMFGPDRLLYAGIGDGGSGGDPLGHGQNRSTLLATILRLDVGAANASRYTVPPTNPFVGQRQARPEIYAYGLRNPWRFSFDPVGGTLWVADVGQGALEEVSHVIAGGNYGWKIREGNRCYEPRRNCRTQGLVEPIHVYPRGDGKSITGGHVYRGERAPSLVGSYIFGDYVSRKIWGLQATTQGEWRRTELATAPASISAFGRDQAGEIYVLGHDNGQIYRIDVVQRAAEQRLEWPQKLSDTGCYRGQTADGQLNGYEYDVRQSFWSDGAVKHRAIALPPGQQLATNLDEVWQAPVGTALMKEFRTGNKRIETRIMARSEAGWLGATYRWQADGRDAQVVQGATTAIVDAEAWYLPSPSECAVCHSSAAGALSLRTDQLNLWQANGQHQMITMAEAGLLIDLPAGDPDSWPALSQVSRNGDLTEVVRDYLDVNCAACHNPQGSARGDLDLRRGLTMAELGLCNQAPEFGDLGVNGAKLIAPGEPARSIVWLRMQSDDPEHRMPQIGRLRGDQLATELVADWIRGGAGCD